MDKPQYKKKNHFLLHADLYKLMKKKKKIFTFHYNLRY